MNLNYDEIMEIQAAKKEGREPNIPSPEVIAARPVPKLFICPECVFRKYFVPADNIACPKCSTPMTQVSAEAIAKQNELDRLIASDGATIQNEPTFVGTPAFDEGFDW